MDHMSKNMIVSTFVPTWVCRSLWSCWTCTGRAWCRETRSGNPRTCRRECRCGRPQGCSGSPGSPWARLLCVRSPEQRSITLVWNLMAYSQKIVQSKDTYLFLTTFKFLRKFVHLTINSEKEPRYPVLINLPASSLVFKQTWVQHIFYLDASVITPWADFSPIPSWVEVVEAAAWMCTDALVTNQPRFETCLECSCWKNISRS